MSLEMMRALGNAKGATIVGMRIGLMQIKETG